MTLAIFCSCPENLREAELKKWINLFGKGSFNIVYYILSLNTVWLPACGCWWLLLAMLLFRAGSHKADENDSKTVQSNELSKSLNTFSCGQDGRYNC